MQINATRPLPPVAGIDRHTTYAQLQAQTTKAIAESAAKKVWTPAPPLRPNVQDFVDIDRTLMSLRKP